MNFLTLIFSLLLILSFGTHLILEKQNSQKKLRSSIMGHLAAQRKILSQCEQHSYQAIKLPITPVQETRQSTAKKRSPQIPKINPECAKINLFPLIQEGKEAEPLLYEIMTRLIKTFYGPVLFKDAKEEIPFLTAFLQVSKKALEKKELFALEKLSFENPKLQRIYYQMLKGTKDPSSNKGFPSLLDVTKVEENKTKICLAHAHLSQLKLLFGPQIANRLFQEIHQDLPTPLTKELIERIYSECHALAPSPSLLNLIEFGTFHPHKNKTTYIAEDSSTHVTLKKNIYIDLFHN